MIKCFAFYFPQFYAIEENSRWWGDGFTDWDLVRRAMPLFPGHHQPLKPKLGYLDQSKPEVIAQQAQLAHNYGLAGFNFYHYWFSDRSLLDQPVNNLRQQEDLPIEYMLTWANESWTRQWVGRPRDYLIRQEFPSGEKFWKLHFTYLLRYFSDSRYLKVDNAPVWCIYRPELIADLPQRLAAYRTYAQAEGFKTLHVLGLRAYDNFISSDVMSTLDGVILFNPRFALNLRFGKSGMKKVLEKWLRRLPEKVQSNLASFRPRRNKPLIYRYQDFINALIGEDDLSYFGLPAYYSVFPGWDNTARYRQAATLFLDSTPELFESALHIAKSNLSEKHQPWLFINAWNEWSEGAYLEPDERFGDQNLKVVKRVIES